MSNRQVMSVAESARRVREKRSTQMDKFRKSARVAVNEDLKVRDISRSPAGQLLKERLEAKLERTLNGWLKASPGDATAAITAHAQLNEIRELIAQITPAEREQETEDE